MEGAHDTFDPGLVDLCHEGPDSLLGDGASRVTCKQSRILPGICGCRTRAGGLGRVGRICRRGWIRVHEKHKLDIATSEKAMDVIVLETIDIFQISMNVRFYKMQFLQDASVRSMQGDEAELRTYKALFPHCTSSTMSRLL